LAIDVTVFGAGIFGLSCAWAMARRGASVRIVDPAGIGVGASGGIVGALAPHVPEGWNEKKAFQLDSLLMAEEWWAGVARAGGIDAGYARTGRLQPIRDAEGLRRALERAEGADALWRGRADWRVENAPAIWSPDTSRVIRDTLTARIHPRRACAALAAALRDLGAEIVPEAEAEGLVLHATGWHGLAAMRDASARPSGCAIKGQAVLLALDRRDAPQLYVDGLHVVPHADGTTAVGSTSERDFSGAEVDGQADALLARATAAVPDLVGAPVLERWAGLRPRARSRAPLLGAWPGRSGHFVANGGFKIGFGMAPKVAEVMADLVLEGRDAVPEGFRTDGLAPWAGGR
jgi:glycine/D-amino acid oxidase-like deaminating enzyme